MTFDELRQKNRERCESPDGFAHALDSWRPSQWSNAMAGEVGEACNLAKKIDRHLDATRGNLGNDSDVEELKRKLAREIGDVGIYADLFAQRMGTTLEACIRDAFNAKSDQIGSSLKLSQE
jgi:NTP pyrophosphatase (non-canonical NTP hydrolase)